MRSSSRIATLTLNPAIDLSSEADKVVHTHKVRTTGERLDPGGGGINVARVLHRFGADVTAIFLGGGVTGRVLEELLERGGIDHRMIEIADDTRLSLTVVEQSTGREYRFVPEGPAVTGAEAAAALEAASDVECGYFVASGSLPRGMPETFYADLHQRIARPGLRFVLDTSGGELRAALERGGIFLVKPSRSELEEFAGRELPHDSDLVETAEAIVGGGKAEHVAITLGAGGAILVNGTGAMKLAAIKVKACSAVGAGDSFLAGIVHGFASGASAREAFRLGMAAGAAAAISCGTQLCDPEDVRRLLAQQETAAGH